MIIGVDGNEANIKNRVGSNIYSLELLRHFRLLDEKNKYIIYLKSQPLPDLPDIGKNWNYKVVTPGKLWTRWRLPLELLIGKPRPDVFFTPGHYAPKYSSIPMAVSVMDLSFLHFPQMFKKKDLYKLKNWTKEGVKKSQHVFTISEYTKNDLISHYKIKPEKITVSYPGYNRELYSRNLSPDKIKACRMKYGLTSDYLIYIGTLQPRKNLKRLIQSFSMLNTKDLKLLIVGKKGWHYHDIFAEVERLGLSDRVVFTGFVEDEEKLALLKGAKSLVLVSLYEGFGIPVVEALASNIPVVISNSSSLPEIGDKTAILVNPESTESISEGLRRSINFNEKLREEMKNSVSEHLNKFDWKKSSRKTLEVLHEIAV